VNETTQGDGETEAPLIAPRPGSIIRRTARTKIRKGPNDGSRRYSSGRRQRLTSPSQQHILGESSSMEDGSDRRSDERRSDETSEETSEAFHEPAPLAVDSVPASDDSADESQILDAYARESVVEPYDGSRSPSPDEAAQRAAQHGRQRPHLTPITTGKPAEPHRAQENDLTPTQHDADLSAALHAVTLLPTSGTSDDIFQVQDRPDSFVDNYVDAYAGDEAYRAYLEEEEEGPPAPSPPSKAAVAQQQQQQQPQLQQPLPPSQQALPPGMAPPLQGMPPSMSTSGQQRPVPPTLVIDRPPLARTDSNTSVLSSASSTTTTTTASTSAPHHHHGREKEKEKGRKSLFGKKHHKDKEKDKPKKEKDGFLGGLFGGSKKKQEETSSVANFATAGPAAAAALLGTSKSAKSLQPSGASSPTSPGFSNFARYPIHVERAVYRLSHIKLANARRPLIEQVLISNLMFWYLGVIGRAAGPAEDAKPGTVNGLDKDRDESQRTPPLKGTPPQSPDSGQFEDKSAHLRQQPPALQQQQRREEPRREEQQQELSPPPSPSPTRKSGLVKPERSRNSTNSEAAYRAPQYGIQNAQMDHEMRPAPHKAAPQPQPQQPPVHRTSPPPQQREQQQQQQPYQQSPTPSPRTSSIPSNPQRTRSPPSPAPPHQHQQQRPEYPPGVAPPRPQQFAPGGGRPLSQQGRPQHPPGAQPARPQPTGVRPPPQQQHQGPPQQVNGSMRPDRPMYAPYPSGGGGGPPQRNHSNGGQPGQPYQYPQQYARPGHHGGPQPGQIFSAQPGQIFHHPQYSNPQRPPGGPPAQNWGEPQRLPPGQQQGPALAQTPPRRTSSNASADPYGRQGYQQSGQTSPTHGGFYSQQRPPAQYQQYPPGQQRAQPVPSGQYPHHR
jgi:hypothetical protein